MKAILFRRGLQFIAALFFAVAPGAASALTAVGEAFDTAPDPAWWRLSGDAVWDASTQAIFLAGAADHQAGSIFWLWEMSNYSFSASFDLWIGAGSGGEGLTFGWVKGPDFLGGGGDSLGFDGLDGYAIRFDTHGNGGGEPENSIAFSRSTLEGREDLIVNSNVAELEDGVDEEGNPAPFHLGIFVQGGALVVMMSNPRAATPLPETKVLEYILPDDYELSDAYFGFTATTSGLSNVLDFFVQFYHIYILLPEEREARLRCRFDEELRIYNNDAIAFSSDRWDDGTAVEADEELISPPIDCTEWLRLHLNFNKNFRANVTDPDYDQIAEVDIRAWDDALSRYGEWINLLHWDIDSVDPNLEPAIDATPVSEDLSAYNGKMFQLRWHYYDANWDWWFAVDDIAVFGEPVPEPPPPPRPRPPWPVPGEEALTLCVGDLGWPYTIEYTDDLLNGTWKPGRGASWPTTASCWTDDITGVRQRFYRIRME